MHQIEHYSELGRVSRMLIRRSRDARQRSGKIKGAGSLGDLLETLAQPRKAIDNFLGREDFNHPGTWRLLDLTTGRPDIVHCHNLHGKYFDLTVLPWLSAKSTTVLTLHDSWLLSGHCAHSFDCARWIVGCGHCLT